MRCAWPLSCTSRAPREALPGHPAPRGGERRAEGGGPPGRGAAAVEPLPSAQRSVSEVTSGREAEWAPLHCTPAPREPWPHPHPLAAGLG